MGVQSKARRLRGQRYLHIVRCSALFCVSKSISHCGGFRRITCDAKVGPDNALVDTFTYRLERVNRKAAHRLNLNAVLNIMQVLRASISCVELRPW